MLIIIDGYNVLKPASSSEHVSERRRDNFLKRVIAYMHESKNQSVVVFDGGDSSFPERIKKNGVTIIYSGYRSTADDVIKKLLHEQEHIDDVLLVSTDRELSACAQRLNIVSVDSHNFYTLLMDDNKKDQPERVRKTGLQKRPGHQSSAEVDAIMQEVDAMMVPHSDRDVPINRAKGAVKKQQKKLSKQERRIQKIIKKL